MALSDSQRKAIFARSGRKVQQKSQQKGVLETTA